MPTGRRRAFASQSLDAFKRRTFRDAELIVVDDGEDPVSDLCAGDPAIRYVRLNHRTPTGLKLNIGIEHARGEIIQKTDDDDWYGPAFIETAVTRLQAPHLARDAAIVAWDCFLVLLVGDGVVRFSGHGWTTGGTLCFDRKLWLACPFREVWGGVDGHFLRDHPVQIERVCAPETYMVVRHGCNTWTMMDLGETTDHYLGACPVYCHDVEGLTGSQGVEFFRGLSRGDRSLIS